MFLGLRDLVPAAGEGYVSNLVRTHKQAPSSKRSCEVAASRDKFMS